MIRAQSLSHAASPRPSVFLQELAPAYSVRHTHKHDCKLTQSLSKCFCSCLPQRSGDMTGLHVLELWSFALEVTQQAAIHIFYPNQKRGPVRFYFSIRSFPTMCSSRGGRPPAPSLPGAPTDLSYTASGKPCLGSSPTVHRAPYKGVSKVNCLRRTNRRADPFAERPGARARLLPELKKKEKKRKKSIGCPQESSRPPT